MNWRHPRSESVRKLPQPAASMRYRNRETMRHFCAKLSCGGPRNDANNVGGFRWCRRLSLLALSTILLAGQLSAGTIITYQISDLGANVFRYEFLPSNLGLRQHLVI